MQLEEAADAPGAHGVDAELGLCLISPVVSI